MPAPDQPRTTWSPKSIARALGPTAVLGLLWTASPAILGIVLVAKLGPIREWLISLGGPGWAVYVGIFILSAGFGFLPTYGQSILGGWTFGFNDGFPAAMTGFVGGSVIGYFVARRVSRHRVEDLLESNPKARVVRDALIGRGFWRTLAIVTLIRVPPNSPFALTNLVLSASGVRLLPFVLGTAIGMAPRTGIAVGAAALAGRQARDIQSFVREGPGLWVLGAGFALTMVVLGIIGALAKRALQRATRAAVVPPDTGGQSA